MGLQVDLLKSKYPHNTEFIDFSFDGKKITDFGLVAVVDGDRLQFDGSPSFTDETTAVNGVVGQYYWGTNIGTKTKTYTLATDGMTEQQVQAFQYHFRPGRYGKFIDDTFAFRYSYCRVSSVTNFKMIPFKKEIEYTVDNTKIKSFVNEYKGEVTISFTWDYPYSFSEANYIDKLDLLTGIDAIQYWRAVANNQLPIPESWNVYIPRDTGVLGYGELGKLILGYEGLTASCHLGSDLKLFLKDFKKDEGHSAIQGSNSVKNRMLFYNPSTVETPCEISIEKLQLHFTPIGWDKSAAEWTTVYFNDIVDTYNKNAAVSVQQDETQENTINYIPVTEPYNTITITDKLTPPDESAYEGFIQALENEEGIAAPKHVFHYTTPSIINQIHLAISIAERYSKQAQINIIEMEEELRETIINEEVLAWTMGVLTFLKGKKELTDNTGTLFKNDSKLLIDLWYVNKFNVKVEDRKDYECHKEVNWFGYFNILMLHFFMGIPDGFTVPLDSLSLEIEAAEKANGWVGRRKDKTGTEPALRKIWLYFDGCNNKTIIRYSGNYIAPDGKVYTVNTGKEESFDGRTGWSEKECGDVILSSYLKLGGGNSLTPDGHVASCYCLSFKHGGNHSAIPTTKLRYKYTYI